MCRRGVSFACRQHGEAGRADAHTSTGSQRGENEAAGPRLGGRARIETPGGGTGSEARRLRLTSQMSPRCTTIARYRLAWHRSSHDLRWRRQRIRRIVREAHRVSSWDVARRRIAYLLIALLSFLVAVLLAMVIFGVILGRLALGIGVTLRQLLVAPAFPSIVCVYDLAEPGRAVAPARGAGIL